MLIIGKTRFGKTILLQWSHDRFGEIQPIFQEFTKNEELFDAMAVYTLIAIRAFRRSLASPFALLILAHASHYEETIEVRNCFAEQAAALGMNGAFEIARYGLTLLDVAFK